MATAATTFWVIYLTLTPSGIKYQYMQEFGSLDKCSAMVEMMRASKAIDARHGVDCTNVQPEHGRFEFVKPYSIRQLR
jgi:hypothetical protein